MTKKTHCELPREIEDIIIEYKNQMEYKDIKKKVLNDINNIFIDYSFDYKRILVKRTYNKKQYKNQNYSNGFSNFIRNDFQLISRNIKYLEKTNTSNWDIVMDKYNKYLEQFEDEDDDEDDDEEINEEIMYFFNKNIEEDFMTWDKYYEMELELDSRFN